MRYEYTVFQTAEGYTWSNNTPPEYHALEKQLKFCERDQEIFLFFHQHVFRIRHSINSNVTVRVSEYYEIIDFRSVHTGYFPDLTKQQITDGRIIIQNLLSGKDEAFTGIHFTDENAVLGSLEYAASHLPARLLTNLVILSDAENSIFRRSADLRFPVIDIPDNWTDQLPLFQTEENQLYTALWYAKGRQHECSMLKFILRMHERNFSFRNYDSVQDYHDYLKLLADVSVMQEVNQKFGTGTDLKSLISPDFAEKIILACVRTEEEMLRGICLMRCYHVPESHLLKHLEGIRPATMIQTPDPFCMDVYKAFVKTCQQESSEKYSLEEATLQQIFFITEYCIENQLSTNKIISHISTKDKNGKDFIVFQQWYAGSKEIPLQDEENLIPVICTLFGSKFIDRNLCLKFYGNAARLRKAEKSIDGKYMPLAYRQISAQSLRFLLKKALTRFLNLHQEEKT